ncbi:MAG: hypothetical protein ABSD73_02195 [Candidatus Bathyarchaeia archaeon]|jgi:hypothetical protein
MTRSRPMGVTTVGILTIFSALALFYLALSIWLVSALMGPFAWSGFESYVLGFGVILLVDAVSILRGVRFGWHFSVVVWILMFVFLCVVYYSWGLFGHFGVYFMGGYPDFESIRTDFVLACPFLYVIGCLLYFQKRHVKEYFGA